jgi:hypothetical protein
MGGSSSSIPALPNPWTINSNLSGGAHIDTDLDNIHIAEIAPIDATSTIKVPDPIVTKSSSDSDAKIDLKVEPLSVTSDSKSEIDSRSEIDLKPVAVDSCQTIKLAPLPPSRIEQPYSQHFGFTFMGVELFGFNTSGRYETLLNTPPAAARGKRHEHWDRPTPPTVVGRPHGISVRVIDSDE